MGRFLWQWWASVHVQVVNMTLVSMGSVGTGGVSDWGFHRVPHRRGCRHRGLWPQAGRCRQEPRPVGPQHHPGQDTHTTRQVDSNTHTHTHLRLAYKTSFPATDANQCFVVSKMCWWCCFLQMEWGNTSSGGVDSDPGDKRERRVCPSGGGSC